MNPEVIALAAEAIKHKQDDNKAPASPSMTFKQKLIIGGILVTGVLGYFGYRAYRRVQAEKELRKSYDESQPSYYASKLNEAMWGPGTDEEVIRQVLRAIPSKEFFNRVVKSYDLITGDSLPERLIEDLTVNEYNEMIQILATKPEKGNSVSAPIVNEKQYLAWAKRLQAAFDKSYWIFPGTDNDAIKAVIIEIPTKAAFQNVSSAYKTISGGKDLMDDLMGELEFWERSEFRQMIDSKP